MRRLLAAAMLAAVTALAAGTACAQTLRIALREDADMLDPTLARTYVGRIVFAGLCDKLFDIDEKLQIVPQLATGYEWADPKTLVIHLRPNVLFQDGETLDAAAVKYTLDRHLTMQGSFRRSEISAIDHVEVVDPLTVRVVLKIAVRCVPVAADRPCRHDRRTQGGGGGGQEFRVCIRSAPGRSISSSGCRRTASCWSSFRGYWNAKDHPFRQGDLPADRRQPVRLANLHTGSIDMVERVVPTDVAAVKADRSCGW